MNQKELKVKIPKGYEIDEDNSTFECIKFKPKSLIYKDIAEKLFLDKRVYYINDVGNIWDFYVGPYSSDIAKESLVEPNNCTSYKQADKILAINKIMNVVKYLNGGEEVGLTPERELYYPGIAPDGKVSIFTTRTVGTSFVYFLREDDLAKAVEILGASTFRLALSSEY